MIYLKKGQQLFDNPGMVVYDSTGYYNDSDTIICSSAMVPDEPVCRYEAQFIAYGGSVYTITDPDKLMEEIMKMDPDSLYGKDTRQVALDKMVENIVPQKSEDLSADAQTTVPDNIDTTPKQESAPTTPPIIPPIDTNTSTTTPITLPPINTGTSTTTPQIVPPVDLSTSTTTPNIIPPIDTNISTTTPQVRLPDETSTTTPQIILPTDTGASTTTPTTALPDSNVSTTTQPVVLPPIDTATSTEKTIDPVLDTPSDAISTSSEVVAFAKKLVKNKIAKELGL